MSHFRIPLRAAQAAIACAALLGLAGSAQAQSDKPILKATTITTYPPFEYKDVATGKLMGLEIDLGDAIAARIGHQVEWTEASFAQVISFVPITTKRADIAAAGLGDTPDKREKVNMLAMINDPLMIITLRANAAQYPTLEALCGKRVATTRSAPVMVAAVQRVSDETCVKAGKPAMTIVGTDGMQVSRLEMMQGRVDAALQGAVALTYVNRMEGNRYVAVGEPAIRVTYGIAFGKDDMALGQRMKKALDDMIADGSYAKVMGKWDLPAAASVTQATINGEP